MNEMFSQQTAKDILKTGITAVLAAVMPVFTLPVVDQRIRAIQMRQIELIGLAKAESAEFDHYDEEVRRLHEEKMMLMQLKADLEISQQSSLAIDRRMEEIDWRLTVKAARSQNTTMSVSGS